MTERLIETGSGQLAVRVSVEGAAIEFVSDPLMEKTTSDGRRRLACLNLMGEGITLEEHVNIPEATIDVSGNTIVLNETEAEDLSQLFHQLASYETFINATYSESATSIDVLSTTGVTAGMVVHDGTEAIKLHATTPHVGNALVVASGGRGYWDTVAQKHYSNDPGVQGAYTRLRDRHHRLRGRRVRIFFYSDGDDLQGDGTQRWLGKTTSEPALDPDGTTWRFSVDSIAASLRTKLGAELAQPTTPRGIYYHWAALLDINVRERLISTGATSFAEIKHTGQHETQIDFAGSLQGELDTALSSFDSIYRVVLVPDGTWTVSLTVGSDTQYAEVLAQSAVDGISETGTTAWENAEGEPVVDFTAGETYYLRWGSPVAGARLVPRGSFGRDSSDRRDESARATYPEDRIYVSEPVSDDWTAVSGEWPDDGESPAISIVHGIIDSSTTENWIELDHSRSVAAGGAPSARGYEHRWTPAVLPKFKPGRQIATGDLADLRDGLVADGPIYANRGTAPGLADVDLADWHSVIDVAARGRAYLTHRVFTIFAQQQLDEYLSHHCRVYSVFPALDANGKIGMVPFAVPNATTADVTDIDDEIYQEDVSAHLEPDSQGSINTVVLHDQYDPSQDEFRDTYTVIDATAYADDHEPRVLEIKPQSTSAAVLTPAQAEDLTLPVRAYFGAPYETVVVPVSWKLFPLRCGSVVAVNSFHLPDFTGLRPMTALLGIVVGRVWRLGQAYGELTVLISPQNIAGYAPTARFDGGSATNVSGDTWDIVITTGRDAPAGYTEDEAFLVGDAVQAETWDSESPTTVLGTIDAIDTSTHTIRVTFTSTFTPGSGKWLMCFQPYSACTDSQKAYCFTAANDGRIGSAENARTFAA